MIKISIESPDFQRVGQELVGLSKNMNKYTANAINKGLTVGKPLAERMTTQTYNIGPPNLGMRKASPGDLDGWLDASGGMLPASQFDPSSTGGQHQVVSVSILRGTRKPITSSSRGPGISGAFM